jgi:hypothetical protein
MSDSRTMIEFREDLEQGVPFPDFAAIEKRGRSVRRRRQIVPIAVVAIAALGVGLFNLNADRDRDDLVPAPAPTVTQLEPPGQVALGTFGGSSAMPGEYAILGLDAAPDATVTLVGHRWDAWRAGALMSDETGAVAWALDEYEQINANPCLPDTHPPATRAHVIQLATQIPGVRIIQAPEETQVLGRPATHIEFSTLSSVRCPDRSAATVYGYTGDADNPRVKVDLWALDDVDQMLLLIVTTKGNPTAATLDQLEETVASIQLASN